MDDYVLDKIKFNPASGKKEYDENILKYINDYQRGHLAHLKGQYMAFLDGKIVYSGNKNYLESVLERITNIIKRKPIAIIKVGGDGVRYLAWRKKE